MAEDMNYTLGRGELHFNKFLPGTKTGIGERYFGNTPTFTLNAQVTNLDHYNSDHGVKEKDNSIALQTDRTGQFTTDHISMDSVALFWFGAVNAVTVAAATGLAFSFSNVQPGLFYQLGASDANPMGDMNVLNVVVTGKTEGTDYMLNDSTGRIQVLEGGSIVAGSTMAGTYGIAATTTEQVVSGSTPIEGVLRFIADNPEGDNIDYLFPWAKITPNGDFALKGDDWQALPFTVEILKRPGFEAVIARRRPAMVTT